MIVNGLKLPDRLVKLLDAARWKRPTDITVLAEMTGVEHPQEFAFYELDGMIRNTDGGILLWKEGYGHDYSLTSSSDPQTSNDPTYLNVDKAVCIMVNWEEETIYLDYRESLDEPKVALGFWPAKGRCEWKVISETFDEFAERLGL